ncbi:hypothetical protein PP410_gp23 [Vibrio phage NF]|uniref:Uncharacterized protein n=1 Tax=Vibrio phage NF TaxID=2686202 RepID=A0A6B9J002_9CAUD|nr:hypothetical protein PP410_gp23 [Vibrio phage NF]QGZ13240.1 hypothetical protein [Vibrio phage NF]
MKIYNSYQEAKIANQEKDIFSLQGKYTCGGDEPLHPDSQGCYWTHCEPSDYLMSVSMFINSGHKISAGDTFIDTDGKVETMTEIDAINNCINDDDDKRYILKSAWIKDKIPTESTEEREALDMIDTTLKQVESLANNSESLNSSKYNRAVGGPVKLSPPEWIGEGLPPVGVECEYFHRPRGLWVRFIPLLITDNESSPNKIPAIYGEWYHPNDCMWEPDLIDLFDNPKFRKAETPQQRKERERLEEIKEMAQTPKPCGFAIYDICEQLYDAGYRKESK